MKMRLILAVAATAGLAACTQTAQPEMNMAGDALPSAEVLAFQRVHDRLGYANARIEWDNRECAVYQATSPSGQGYREPLVGQDGRPLCSN